MKRADLNISPFHYIINITDNFLSKGGLSVTFNCYFNISLNHMTLSNPRLPDC